jgi:hypothetical protein
MSHAHPIIPARKTNAKAGSIFIQTPQAGWILTPYTT